MKTRVFVLLALLLLGSAGPALADLRILSSPGGQVVSYMRLFALVRATGDRVVIDGPCFSACTLALGLLPRRQVCVTRRAVLGFHAPFIREDDGEEIRLPETTQAMLSLYPRRLQSWIRQRGGLTERPIYLRGRALAALFPTCR